MRTLTSSVQLLEYLIRLILRQHHLLLLYLQGHCAVLFSVFLVDLRIPE